MGHVLGCWVVTYPQLVLNLGVSLPWFFILFIFYDIDVIVSKCYPGWLPSETSWPSTGYSSFVWEDPQTSFLWGLAGGVVDTELFGVCVGYSEVWGIALNYFSLFRSRRPLFILGSVKEVGHVYHVVISISF